ncbi:hypothetical protein [Sphingobium yanoikuyae]|uniref:hypothetical protein n=1 Tax=Sphingobium yanoikuyae TaxID=13690 RepID=UPI00293CF4E0|nr:hypothetical protein [Sphingobium yanoikuyae]MDV3482224.1 hypothetical protein [Sphingobium yanoikuyae]
MLKSLMVAARDRERLGEVTRVLARYGLDTAIDRFGLGAKDLLAGEAAGDCQDFRVWPGIMGNKESHYVTTQRTCHTE